MQPPALMPCACRHPCHTGEHAPLPELERASATRIQASRRWWIDVALEGSTARVDLSRLVVVRVQGVDVARLDEVWAAAHLGVRRERLVFDFVGDDGFHIATNDRPGVGGQELATGYVCVATRNLVWQPSPPRPCYWRVKGVERAIASRA